MNKEQNDEYIVVTSVKNPDRVEKRRAQIIAAAVQIFSEKGYHDTTTKEIAERAGMNVGTMFQYVQNKQDILYLVCVHIHGMIEEALFSLQKDDKLDPFESLAKDVSALIKVVDQLSDYVLIMYQETASLEKAARRSFLQREQRLSNHLEKQIKNGVDAGIFNISKDAVPLLAEDILVQAQMWAFRRWSLSTKYTIDTYITTRIKLLQDILISPH